MKSLVCALPILLLAACASVPPTNIADEPARPSLYDDASFAPSSVAVSPEEIFALSPEMRNFLDTQIARRVTTEGKVPALVDALFDKSTIKFSYNAAETTNAAGVFASHSGNCLSYTIMTAAFAREMHIPVQFHVATFADVWDRSNDTDFLIGHVNLTLGFNYRKATDQQAQLVDFTAMNNAHGQLLDDIGEDVIVSMYLNNRAAEAMAHGKIDDAYWWARAATQSSPSFIAAYNTLGVIYMNHHNPAMAARVFERVLEREPENVLALSNESLALKAQGRTAEAAAMATRLAQIQPNPPFYYFTLGIQAMQQRDYKTAKAEFTKEVNRASYNHQFHFWLALAEYNLGEFGETRKQLTFAMENSPNDQQHDLYAAKLAALQQKQGITN
jgi:Flp pilus assembly protein TadD